MEPLILGKIRTLLGLLLILGIFIFPIAYTSFNLPATAEPIPEQSDEMDYNMAKLIHHKKINEIDSFLLGHQKRLNFQGNVLVGYRGNLIYNKSFGYSNPSNKTPLSEDHVFQLASITKQFTAMGIMILKEQGLLKYTDTVSRYIEDFPYKDITIKMLLNHTSGLPNYMWLLEHHWQKDTPPYNDDMMELLGKHKLHLHFTPGTRFSYSNTGYVVLAYIIEEISRQRYDRFMKQHIFDPLGMENSFAYSTAYEKSNKSHLFGYRQWGHHFRSVANTVNDGTIGDKGIYSTALDLYKWDKGLYENILISEQTKKQAFESLELKNGNHYPYGFGFRLKEIDGKNVVYHYGKWNGFRTGIIRLIDDTSTIIILNHTDRPYNSRITRNVASILNQIT